MIRGQKSTADQREQITVPLDVKYHNRFDFEVIDSVTGEVKQQAFAENIILDRYWTWLLTTPRPTAVNTYIYIGTGSGTLSPARTALFTPLANKASTEVVNVFNEAEGWFSHKRVATWQENEAMNTNWTEVGIGGSSGLTTHALVKDLNGNPVTLVKGTTDIIKVYSTLYVYVPPSTDSIKFYWPKDGLLHEYSLFYWLAGLNTYQPLNRTFPMKGRAKVTSSGYSGSWSGACTLSYITAGSQTTKTTVPASRKLKMNMVRLPAASYNTPQGIGAIAVGVVSFGNGNGIDPTSMDMVMDMQFTVPAPWFPHSSVVAETIGTGDGANLNFNTYFPFLKNDGSFVLKNNGAVVDPSDYTVVYGEPNGDDLVHHLKLIDQSHLQASLGGGDWPSFGTVAACWLIFENPFYTKYGINTLTLKYGNGFTSDNPTGPWTACTTGTSGGAIAVEHKNKRYWKVSNSSSNYQYACAISAAKCTALAAAKNVQFAVGKAPLLGDVITADYHCEVIAKTVNNVFDLSVEITLQEKVV